jgi:hypothetical protein
MFRCPEYALHCLNCTVAPNGCRDATPVARDRCTADVANQQLKMSQLSLSFVVAPLHLITLYMHPISQPFSSPYSPTSGMLESNHGGQFSPRWGQWTNHGTRIACRRLGLPFPTPCCLVRNAISYRSPSCQNIIDFGILLSCSFPSFT